MKTLVLSLKGGKGEEPNDYNIIGFTAPDAALATTLRALADELDPPKTTTLTYPPGVRGGGFTKDGGWTATNDAGDDRDRLSAVD